jgi:hypothetical protein
MLVSGVGMHSLPDMPNNNDKSSNNPSTNADNGGDEVGEGNRDADRRYREATERYAKSGAVEPAAKEARRAIDDDREREELKKAEDQARHHADPKPR